MITRRKFIRGLALGAASSAVALSGCQPASPRMNTPTSAPTATLTAAATLPAADRTQRSPLVRTRHDRVWQGEDLSGEALLQMLDASITALVGIQDAGQAWKSLFQPSEKVAIKVNSIANGAVHPALALAVTQRLQDAGLAAEQICIFDRMSSELSDSGYPVNRSGKGIACYGSDGEFADAGEVAGMSARLNRWLAGCDALINLCILKGFTLGGMSFALKNHYGSVDNPGRFHNTFFTPGISGLNALPQIKDRTRLVIGDLLSAETRTDYTDYIVLGEQNSILMSRDPVAMDATGLDMICAGLNSIKGMNTRVIEAQAKEWLKAVEDSGLGVGEAQRVDIREIRL